jgi:hypothetical protein
MSSINKRKTNSRNSDKDIQKVDALSSKDKTINQPISIDKNGLRLTSKAYKISKNLY